MLHRGLLRAAAISWPPLSSCRSFSAVTCLRSGHNRWSKIKHDKGKNDAAKSKERTGLVLGLIRASKDGGANPEMNTALAFAITSAKRAQVSKEAIEKAVAKGQGKSLSGAALDNVLIEAMLPYGVAAIMEGQTENKNRILADVKMIVQRAGGSITPVAFSFNKKGKIWFKQQEAVGEDDAMDVAIDAGAEEITSEEGQLVVETPPELISAVAQKMQQALGLEVERSQILYDPKEETLAQVNESQASEVQLILDQLEDLDDVQEVYINAVT